jgi:hypothetical protein
VPLDLMKAEQDRIAAQLAAIEARLETIQVRLDVVERNLRTARYANNCYAGYLSLTASPHVRRLFDQAFFDRIYVEQDLVRVELAEPFNTLLGSEVHGEAEDDQRVAPDSIALMDAIKRTGRTGPVNFAR